MTCKNTAPASNTENIWWGRYQLTENMDQVKPSYTDGEGPLCPVCLRQYTADEPIYFDESGFEMDCDECGNAIRIEPHVTTAWTTRLVKWAEK